MKKVIIIFIFILVILGYLFFFKKEPSVDFENEYQISEVLEDNERVWGGVLPCVDCEGVLISLVLSDFDLDHKSGSFTYSELYLGEEGGPYIKSGNWQRLGGEVVFDPKSDEFEEFSYTLLENDTFLVKVKDRIAPDLDSSRYVLQEEL